MFSGELLAASLKARPRRGCNCRCWVGAACRLLCYNELAEFVLRPRDLCNTGSGFLRWTLMWITNSSMYNGLLVRVTSHCHCLWGYHKPSHSYWFIGQLRQEIAFCIFQKFPDCLHHAVLPLQQMLECSKSSVKTGLYCKAFLRRLYLFCSLDQVLWSRCPP